MNTKSFFALSGNEFAQAERAAERSLRAAAYHMAAADAALVGQQRARSASLVLEDGGAHHVLHAALNPLMQRASLQPTPLACPSRRRIGRPRRTHHCLSRSHLLVSARWPLRSWEGASSGKTQKAELLVHRCPTLSSREPRSSSTAATDVCELSR